ncbi:hypothetical protein [Streptomyces sp. TLI_105]|uniref:hypothetical protein n=1 Tax=Streptomyces sp. TLI_105 TaxID=1881019 RepID=UPI00089BA57E|nr:hypothetical protein [Streptomyces sp. TLI_105]SED35353.1 hypothetical protein SAMN05428939_4963 [Streptomyces sp. TLI_105]
MAKAQGFIDSATLYQIFITLTGDRKHPEGWSDWDKSTALSATIALIGRKEFRVAPGVGVSGAASGSYEQLTRALSDMEAIDHRIPSRKSMNNALAATSAWAAQHDAELRDLLSRSLQDRDNFIPWLEWSVGHSWEEHSMRLYGLFDETLIPLIASLLGQTEGHMGMLHRASRDAILLSRYAGLAKDGNLPQAGTFPDLRDAFIISAFLRGRYHQLISRDQLIQHPIREGLPGVQVSPASAAFTVTPESMLASVILNSALLERKVENRITSWANNLNRAREAHLADRLPLGPPTGWAKKDWARVERVIKEGGIDTYPGWIDGIAAPAAVAITWDLVSNFFLNGWVAVGSDVAISAASLYAGVKGSASKLDNLAIRPIAERRARLQRMAKFPPGLVAPGP